VPQHRLRPEFGQALGLIREYVALGSGPAGVMIVGGQESIASQIEPFFNVGTG